MSAASAMPSLGENLVLGGSFATHLGFRQPRRRNVRHASPVSSGTTNVKTCSTSRSSTSRMVA
jgi:hypothetical protein